ncbi:MAG: DUF5675 family protein [Candidatus Hodarchaeales archaeon]
MKNLVTIERFAYSPFGVFGRLTLEQFSCYTVEKVWKNNERSMSCIPEGSYPLSLSTYNRGGYSAYEILQVPHRSQIKIHIGNIQEDVQGCVALGSKLGYINNIWGILGSREAYWKFMRKAEQFQIDRILIKSFHIGYKM